ncbi:putative mediator of RNA polymerase II transcription subunit 10 isoform X4 [Drosophila hydei]|nr:putative mediator of RNA polymerase II transcription subunit 10 isoform X4 [Drosophila hydei]
MIGTQACLMDYDNDVQQQHPQQQTQQQQPQHQQSAQQQQQQMLHPRIHQHYQDGQRHQPQKLCNTLESLNDKLEAKSESKQTDEAADLYIATHGGCLHHFNDAAEEFEI